MKRPQISIVVAIDEQNAIGKEQGLLCHLPNDLKHFKRLTSGHTVIMGRRTFESLPNGALPNRKNIVLSSQSDFQAEGVIVCRNMDEAIGVCSNEKEVFIIGGASVYGIALQFCDVLYLTCIHHRFEGADTFFPSFDLNEWVVSEQVDFDRDEKHFYPYSFVTLVRRGTKSRC